MSWREDLKVGLLRADQLFIGTANGGLGTDVTAALLALAGLGGSPLVSDIAGSVYDITGAVLVLDPGESGVSDAELFVTSMYAPDAPTVKVADISAATGMAVHGSINPSQNAAGDYIANAVAASRFDLDVLLANPASVLSSPFVTALLGSDEAQILADINLVNLIAFVAEDASTPGSYGAGSIFLNFDTATFVNPFLNISSIIVSMAGLNGQLLSGDFTSVVLDPGATPELATLSAQLLSLDFSIILDSIANTGQVPATLLDAALHVQEVYGVIKAVDATNIIGAIAIPGQPAPTQADSALIIGDIDALGGLLVSQSVTANNFFTGKIQALNADVVIRSIATPAEAPATFEDTAIEAAHFIPQVDSGASGVWDGKSSVIPIDSGATITGFTPQFIGQRVTIFCADSTADATLVAGAGVTFDGTNDTATFADDGDALELIAVSLTRWMVVTNIGAVAFT